MDIYKIYLELFDNPNALKTYRELENFYKTNQLFSEAEAFANLIEKKFEKKSINNDTNSNNS